MCCVRISVLPVLQQSSSKGHGDLNIILAVYRGKGTEHRSSELRESYGTSVDIIFNLPIP